MTPIALESISITTLRQDLFRLADQVLASGKSLVIEKSGQRLLLSPADAPLPRARLGSLKKRKLIVGDARELVDLKVAEWHEPATWRRPLG